MPDARMQDSFYQGLQANLDALREQGLFKGERIIASRQGSRVTCDDGRSLINLCANNYLGLADDPRLIAAAKKAMDDHGFGMASVRFICGTQELHRQLETRLARYLAP